jgi:hypothetical protein
MFDTDLYIIKKNVSQYNESIKDIIGHSKQAPLPYSEIASKVVKSKFQNCSMFCFHLVNLHFYNLKSEINLIILEHVKLMTHYLLYF